MPSPLTNQDRRMLAKAFERTSRELAAELDAKGVTNPEARKMFVAQNVLRACMESVFNACLPYGHPFLMEIASRLAAYAITAAPHTDAKALTDIVATNLHRYVENKLAQGAIIRTTWETDSPSTDAPPAGGVH